MMSEIKEMNKKISVWTKRLDEIENEFFEIMKREKKSDKEIRMKLWMKFKGIADDFRNNFMEMWKLKMYKQLDDMTALVNIVFNDLIKYIG